MKYKLAASAVFMICATFAFLGVKNINAEELRPSNNAQEKRVQLIEDQKNGLLSIQIDGELVAFFAKDGLHVVKNIGYGGIIGDYGQEHVRGSFDALAQKDAENEE